MRKISSILIAFAMIIGLFSTVPVVVKAEHTHVPATDVWLQDDYGHWNPCYGVGNCEEKLNYEAHQTGEYSKMCSVCGRIPHTCYNPEANCLYGGSCVDCGYAAPIDPDNHVTPDYRDLGENAHQKYCACGVVWIESEPHTYPDEWSSNGDGTEERWCTGCLHVQTRKAGHSHQYSVATCVSPAKCSCGATTGSKDASNHTGGTEIRGATEATEDKEGYTGDTYCKGCGAKVKTGEAIPKKTPATTAPNAEPSTPGTDTTDSTVGTTTPVTDPTDSTAPGSDITTSDSDKGQNDATSPDKDSGEDDSEVDGDNLLWLWIVLIVIAVGGGVTAIILVKKKRKDEMI